MPSESLDGGKPWLHSMPLDTAIGQVFAWYHLGGQRGQMQKRLFRWPWWCTGTVCAHRPMEGVQGYDRNHGWCHRASIGADRCNRSPVVSYISGVMVRCCWILLNGFHFIITKSSIVWPRPHNTPSSFHSSKSKHHSSSTYVVVQKIPPLPWQLGPIRVFTPFFLDRLNQFLRWCGARV